MGEGESSPAAATYSSSYLFGRETEKERIGLQAGKKISLSPRWIGEVVGGACVLKGQDRPLHPGPLEEQSVLLTAELQSFI